MNQNSHIIDHLKVCSHNKVKPHKDGLNYKDNYFCFLCKKEDVFDLGFFYDRDNKLILLCSSKLCGVKYKNSDWKPLI